MNPLILVVHAAATWALVGLIWLVQLVHYPLFAGVGERSFRAWHEQHTTRITPLVGVLMAAEGLSFLLLLGEPLPPRARTLLLASGVLLGLHLASTALVQVPLHGRLGAGLDAAAVERLVRTNWIRTLAWTTRGVLVAWIAVLCWRPQA